LALQQKETQERRFILMSQQLPRSRRRIGLAFVGFALYIVIIIVAYLSYPQFTLFWGQDALPIISQVMWYTLILAIGVVIGLGLSYRAPLNAGLTKQTLAQARTRLADIREKASRPIVIVPDVRHSKRVIYGNGNGGY
jgi:hypothetical protein